MMLRVLQLSWKCRSEEYDDIRDCILMMKDTGIELLELLLNWIGDDIVVNMINSEDTDVKMIETKLKLR